MNQVNLLADYTGKLKFETATDFMERGLFGQNTDAGDWQFRKISDGTQVFSFRGYNLSVWGLFEDQDLKIVLWNQWLDIDKAYFEVTLNGSEIKLGDRVTFYNQTFHHLSAHYNSK